jgi:hypothetical protein
MKQGFDLEFLLACQSEGGSHPLQQRVLPWRETDTRLRCLSLLRNGRILRKYIRRCLIFSLGSGCCSRNAQERKQA